MGTVNTSRPPGSSGSFSFAPFGRGLKVNVVTLSCFLHCAVG